jgi:hypothetical protein
MIDNHDQRLKNLIREFFADFMRLFFADWAARFDLTHVEWLDKELLPDPPEGSRHLLDLVAKLRTVEPAGGHDPAAPDTWLALVHIEIESPDKTTLLKPRLPRYFIHLRDAYGLPVLPIVLYLKVGLDGIGVDAFQESFWDLDVLTFRYLYVGLPGLDAIQYAEGDNWLGVALFALMRIPRDQIGRLGREALQRLNRAPLTELQRYLLAECLVHYLSLDDANRKALEEELGRNADERTAAMSKSFLDRARDEGAVQGRHAALVEIAEAVLDKKFGPLPPGMIDRLRAMSSDELRALAPAVVTATSLKELGLAE